MRTLLIDNSVIPYFLRAGEKTARHLPGPVRRIRGPYDSLPTLMDFDRLIVTGSEASATDDKDWIKRQVDFIAYAVYAGKPVLGICFGHQMLARALWGKSCVRRASKPEFGWHEVRLDVSEPLLDGLPQHAHWYCSHFDEVCDPPAETKVRGHSETCVNHAFRAGDYPAWGVQFHPEYHGLHAHFLLAVMRASERGLFTPIQHRPAPATAAERAAQLFANFWRITS